MMESVSHVHQCEGDGPRLEEAGGRCTSEATPDHHHPHGVVQGQAGSHRSEPGAGGWLGGGVDVALRSRLLLALRLSRRRVESPLLAEKLFAALKLQGGSGFLKL